MNVRFDAAPVLAEIDDILARARDLSPAMRAAAGVLEDRAARRFTAEGEGDWPELDPDTIARRAGASSRALVVTGRLRASLTGTSGDAVRQVEADRLVFGTSVPYAPYVASRRNPLPEHDQDLVDDLEQILARYVLEDR